MERQSQPGARDWFRRSHRIAKPLGWALVAVFTLALSSLAVLAQVIRDPEGIACVDTGSQGCSANELAVSNGGNAQAVVAASNGGTATGAWLSLAANGAACSTNFGPSVAIGGSGNPPPPCPQTGMVAIGTQGSTYTCNGQGGLLSPGTSIAVNPTGSAQVCEPSYGPAPWWADGVTAGLAMSILGPAGTNCSGIGAAVSVASSAGSDCPHDSQWLYPQIMIANADVAGMGSAYTCGTRVSATVSVTQSATSCPTNLDGSANNGVAAAPMGSATAGIAAVSYKGNATTPTHSATPPTGLLAVAGGNGSATSSNVAISVGGSAYACGGPVVFSESVTGNSAGGCQGTLPLPVGSVSGPGIYAS